MHKWFTHNHYSNSYQWVSNQVFSHIKHRFQEDRKPRHHLLSWWLDSSRSTASSRWPTCRRIPTTWWVLLGHQQFKALLKAKCTRTFNNNSNSTSSNRDSSSIWWQAAHSSSISTQLDSMFPSKYCWAEATYQGRWCLIKPINNSKCKCKGNTWRCRGAQVVAFQYSTPNPKVDGVKAHSSWTKWRNEKTDYHTIRWNVIMISVKLFKSLGQGQWLHSILPLRKFRLQSGAIFTRVMHSRSDRLKCRVRSHRTTCFSGLQLGIRRSYNCKTANSG